MSCESAIISNQKLKWKVEPLEIQYDYINYDELLNNEDNKIKFIFYCINFILDEINYYNVIGLLRCYTKNKIVLDLYLKWLEKFRISNEDFKIDFGKHKGEFYYNLKYDYLLWLQKNNIINKIERSFGKNMNMRITLDTHLSQHPEKCKKIFYEKDIYNKQYIDYFNEIKKEYDDNEFIEKIIIEHNSIEK